MAQAFNYADGLRWFGEGVRALRNRPLGLVGIVVFYVLISGLLSGLPVVGTILAGVWMPFGAVAWHGRTVLPSSSRKAHVPQSLPERIAVNGIMGILVHVDFSLFNRAASNASLA